MYFKLKFVLPILFTVCLTQPIFAADEETNETLMPKGMWKDPDTGLIWMRCSLGDTWNGNGCDGGKAEYNWWDAIKTADNFTFSEQSDWRVPTTQELSSLMAGSVLSSKEAYVKFFPKGVESWGKMNKTIRNDHVKNYFYSGVEGYKTSNIFKPVNAFGVHTYWSDSPSASSNQEAWVVSFVHGFVFETKKYYNGYARLVRSSQSLGGEALSEFSLLTKTIAADEAVYREKASIDAKVAESKKAKQDEIEAKRREKQDAIEAKIREKQERIEAESRAQQDKQACSRLYVGKPVSYTLGGMCRIFCTITGQVVGVGQGVASVRSNEDGNVRERDCSELH